MKELLVALLIVAAVTVVSYADTPTGFATYKFDKLTVSGGHPFLTQTFSPNGDGAADYVSASASGKCGQGYGSGIGVYDSSGNLIKSNTGYVCVPNSCEYSGTLAWNGKNPDTGKAYMDGTYYVKSGCWKNGNPAVISADKTVAITLNSKLYPASINYIVSGGVACGTKPTCKLEKNWAGWGTGCKKTVTQNTIAWCNGKTDTCLGSDTGSCKANKGRLGNVESCTQISGIGICQATAALPG